MSLVLEEIDSDVTVLCKVRTCSQFLNDMNTGRTLSLFCYQWPDYGGCSQSVSNTCDYLLQ